MRNFKRLEKNFFEKNGEGKKSLRKANFRRLFR
jgi:hypothetical protein